MSVSEVCDAAKEGDIEKLQTLLAAAADVNAANEEGETALHLAAQSGKDEVCEQQQRHT
jgi:ankyrin repeat protein